MLTDVEDFALRAIFCDESALAIAIRDQIDTMIVMRREFTGVGFFAEIKFTIPLQSMPDLRMHEFNFHHPAFSYGGSFMCTVEHIDRMEIEAVSFGGVRWPDNLDISRFRELI